MKKSSKAKLISTVLTLSCTAVLLAFAATSVAWFSNNKEVKIEGISVKCYMDQTVGIINNSFSVYGYNIKNDEAEKTDSLALGDYDAFIKKNNVYARKFIRAELYYPNTVLEGQGLEIKVECEPNHLFKTIIDGQTQHKYIDKYISNLIQFRFLDNFDGSIPKENEDVSNIGEIYNQCCIKFDAQETGITFINRARVPDIESDKMTVISKRVSLPEESYGISGYRTDFFIEYTYNETLLEFYRNHCEDQYNVDVFEGSNIITFEKDITSISFSLVDWLEGKHEKD